MGRSMETAQEAVSQAQLARHFGVSRAAVSQWKSKDILQEDAFTEPGKTGKVYLHKAMEQVRRNRDIGQSLGNGIATRTTGTPALQRQSQEAAEEEAAELPLEADLSEQIASNKPVSVEDQLKRAKLEQQLRTNRMQASEEALRQGKLMAAEDAREQMGRIAGMMLQIFEGALPDFAAATAARFDLPQRDVLHLLRAEFKKVRKTAAMKERARAEVAQKDVQTSVDMEA